MSRDERNPRWWDDSPSEDEDDSDPPRDSTASLRAALERILPELVRRSVEAGRDTLQRSETLRSVVSESKLPKEWVSFLSAQMEEARKGVVSAVTKEVRRFLREADVGTELAKALTSLSFEVKAQIRFVPNESGLGLRPKVDAQAQARPASPDTPPTNPDAPPANPEPTSRAAATTTKQARSASEVKTLAGAAPESSERESKES